MPDDGSQETSNQMEERTVLGYAYAGDVLVAAGYRRAIIEHWEESTRYTVVRTPEGEERREQL